MTTAVNTKPFIVAFAEEITWESRRVNNAIEVFHAASPNRATVDEALRVKLAVLEKLGTPIHGHGTGTDDTGRAFVWVCHG